MNDTDKLKARAYDLINQIEVLKLELSKIVSQINEPEQKGN